MFFFPEWRYFIWKTFQSSHNFFVLTPFSSDHRSHFCNCTFFCPVCITVALLIVSNFSTLSYVITSLIFVILYFLILKVIFNRNQNLTFECRKHLPSVSSLTVCNVSWLRIPPIDVDKKMTFIMVSSSNYFCYFHLIKSSSFTLWSLIHRSLISFDYHFFDVLDLNVLLRMRLYIFLQCDTTSFLTFFFKFPNRHWSKLHSFFKLYLWLRMRPTLFWWRHSFLWKWSPSSSEEWSFDYRYKKATLHIKRNSIWRLLLSNFEEETLDLNITILNFVVM